MYYGGILDVYTKIKKLTEYILFCFIWGAKRGISAGKLRSLNAILLHCISYKGHQTLLISTPYAIQIFLNG